MTFSRVAVLPFSIKQTQMIQTGYAPGAGATNRPAQINYKSHQVPGRLHFHWVMGKVHGFSYRGVSRNGLQPTVEEIFLFVSVFGVYRRLLNYARLALAVNGST